MTTDWCEALERATEDNDDLRERLIAAEKANSILREELIAAKATAQEAIGNVRTVFSHREDVWFWQGEGDDPEGLSCPVVMNVDTIRQFIAVIDAARAWSESIDLGFAAQLRPDIARARLNRALNALDEKEHKQ